MKYDLIIVGMGPAGISGAIYAMRSGLEVLVLEKNAPGGLMNQTNVVNNYPGYPSITGPDLSAKFFEHLVSLKIPYQINEVTDILDGDPYKKVVTKKGTFETKTVVIATGRENKKLGLANEKELMGKGISYCALCDGSLYKDKIVTVIGAGNSAFEEGLYLANIAKEVIILSRSEQIIADDILQDKLAEKKNVTIKFNVQVKEIMGQDKLEKVVLSNGEELITDGLFIYIGYVPATDYVRDLGICNEDGYIIVDNKNETKIKGIYAAGDITKKHVYQIVTASSDGVEAVISAYNYIKSK